METEHTKSIFKIYIEKESTSTVLIFQNTKFLKFLKYIVWKQAPSENVNWER